MIGFGRAPRFGQSVLLADIARSAGGHDIVRNVGATFGQWHKVVLLKWAIAAAVSALVTEIGQARLPILLGKTIRQLSYRRSPFVATEARKRIDALADFRLCVPPYSPLPTAFLAVPNSPLLDCAFRCLISSTDSPIRLTVSVVLRSLAGIMSLRSYLSFFRRSVALVGRLASLTQSVLVSCLNAVRLGIPSVVARLARVAVSIRGVTVAVEVVKRLSLTALVAGLHREALPWTWPVVEAGTGVPKRGHEKEANRITCLDNISLARRLVVV